MIKLKVYDHVLVLQPSSKRKEHLLYDQKGIE